MPKPKESSLSPHELIAQEFAKLIADPAERKKLAKAALDTAVDGNAAAMKTLLGLFGSMEDFHRGAKDQVLVKITNYAGKVPSNICPHCGKNITEKPLLPDMKEKAIDTVDPLAEVTNGS